MPVWILNNGRTSDDDVGRVLLPNEHTSHGCRAHPEIFILNSDQSFKYKQMPCNFISQPSAVKSSSYVLQSKHFLIRSTSMYKVVLVG
jgi:hypothetical protein